MGDIITMNQTITSSPIYFYNSNGDRMDVSASPMIDSQDINVYMEDINRRGKAFDVYKYNGVPVPRVTTILDFCKGDQEYLLRWASNLGSKYSGEKRKTLDIGSKLHEAIAEYMVSGTLYTIQHLRGPVKEEVTNCFRNFLAWYNHIKRLGIKIEVVASEIPLVCPWFGGTTDLIVDLNGKRYILDFKSSKRIYEEYFIQVSAYKWLVDNYYPEYGPIDGVGILRFDKFQNNYEDLLLEVSDPNDSAFIYRCQQIFGIALNMFYATNIFHREFLSIKKTKEQHRGKVGKKITRQIHRIEKGK